MFIRWRTWIFLLVALMCYADIFHNPFIFDDLLGILENRGIRSFWPLWNVMDVLPDETPWGRPAVQLSLALNYFISGLEVWSYHLINILIHVCAAWILCELLRIVLKKFLPSVSDILAFCAALIWLAHPLATSAVTYTVQRAESLMALFYLLTLYFTARSSEKSRPQSASDPAEVSLFFKKPHYWNKNQTFFAAGGIASAFLGVCSKEAFVTAPLAALLLDWAVLDNTWKNILQKRWKYYLGLFSSWILLAFLMWKWPRTDSVGITDKYSSWEYFLIQWQVIIHYLRLAIFPVGLSLDYDWPKVKNIADALPQGIFLTALFGASLWALFKKHALGYLGFLFFLILSPTCSFIPIYTSVATEHRMYLPLTTVVTFGVLTVYFLTEKLKNKSIIRRLGMSFIILALETTTFLRNLDYQNGITIWQDVIIKQPNNKRAWNNLGGMYYQSGDSKTAFECFKRSVDLDPKYAEAFSNVGVILGQSGYLQEGIEWLEKAATIKPKSIQTQINLGLFYFDLGNYERAAESYHRALKINPHHTQSNVNLALIHLKQKKYPEGLALVNRALEDTPAYPGAAQLKDAFLKEMR